MSLLSKPDHAHLADRALYEQYYNVDTTPGSFHLVGLREPRLNWAYERIGPGDLVADIGCHKGEISISCAMLTGCYVTGFDIGQFAVDEASRRAKFMGANALFYKAWAEELPVPDDAFDVALLFELLEHVVDPARCIAEAERVVRPGGLILTSTPMDAIALEEHGGSNVDGYEHLHMHVREWNPAIELLGKPNLQVLNVESPSEFKFYLASFSKE